VPPYLVLGFAGSARSASFRSARPRPSWLLSTALQPPFSIGASGWYVPGAAAGRSVWWSPERSDNP
jgi:hypothetical protein